jgi:hypothetical protein
VRRPDSETKWRDYELKVTDALRATWPGATVSHDAKINGRSGGKVQVDTLVDLPEGAEFMIVDSKDWKDVAWTPSRSTLQAAVFCRRCPSSQVRRTSFGVR